MKYCSMASMKLVINMIWCGYRLVRYIIVKDVSMCDVTTVDTVWHEYANIVFLIYNTFGMFLCIA